MYEFGEMIHKLTDTLKMICDRVFVLEKRVKLLEEQNAKLIHELNRHSIFIDGIIKNGGAEDIYWPDK